MWTTAVTSSGRAIFVDELRTLGTTGSSTTSGKQLGRSSLSPLRSSATQNLVHTQMLSKSVFSAPRPHPNAVLNFFIRQKVASALPVAYYITARRGSDSLMDTERSSWHDNIRSFDCNRLRQRNLTAGGGVGILYTELLCGRSVTLFAIHCFRFVRTLSFRVQEVSEVRSSS